MHSELTNIKNTTIGLARFRDRGGNLVLRTSLPKPGNVRWTPWIKVLFMDALKNHILTREEFLTLYGVTESELLNMEHSVEKFGLEALRITKPTAYNLPQEVEVVSPVLPQEPVAISSGVLTFGDKVKLNDKVLRFSPQQLQTLLYLLHRKNVVVSKAELLKHFYGEKYLDPNIIDVHIARIRKKIGDAKKQHLRTVWGRGFIFVTP